MADDDATEIHVMNITQCTFIKNIFSDEVVQFCPM